MHQRNRSSESSTSRPGFDWGRAGAQSAVEAQFSPLSISGLLLWHDARDMAESEGYVDDQTVVRWSDIGPNGYDLDRNSPTNARPTFQTGGPTNCSIVFDGDDNMDWGGAFTHDASDYTFIAVCRIPTTSTRMLFDSASGRLILYAANSGSVGYWDGSAKLIAAASASSNILIWSLSESGGGEMFRGNTSLGSSTYTPKAIGGATVLGANNNRISNYVGGEIASFIAYDHALSHVNREALVAYLEDRYSVFL